MAGRFRFTPGCCCGDAYHCGDAYGPQAIGPTGNMVAYFNALAAVIGDPRDTAYQKLIQQNTNNGALTTIERSGQYNSDGSLSSNIITNNLHYVWGYFRNCFSINYQIRTNSWMIPAWSSFHFTHPTYELVTLSNGTVSGIGKIEICGTPIETINYQSYFQDIDFEDDHLLFCVPSVSFVLANQTPANTAQHMDFVDINWFNAHFNQFSSHITFSVVATNPTYNGIVLPSRVFPSFVGVDGNYLWHYRKTSILPVAFEQSGSIVIDTTQMNTMIEPTKAISSWFSSNNQLFTEDQFNDLYQSLSSLGDISISPYVTQYLRCDYPIYAFYELKLATIWRNQ